MQQCPKCKSSAIHRSHSRGRWERLRKQVTNRRPYRCSKCGWRGWGVDSGSTLNLADTLLTAVDPALPTVQHQTLDREEQRT
jgi:predicted RNA-binding Zn-ribbon protein involved in translation (DUF1610 family)